jgi:hypothetical protein
MTLHNYTASSLTITYGASGDFTAAGGTCGPSLGAGASCTFNVTFSPTDTGTISGVVSVTYPAGYSPQVATLTGTGQ